MTEVSSLLTFVVPASFGAAWSPFILVTATDIASGGQRSRARGLAFWLGGVVALLVWAVILVSALWGWFQATARDLSRDLPLLETGLGVLLVVIGLAALFQWHLMVATFDQARRRLSHSDTSHSSEPTGKPAHDSSHDSLGRITALGAVFQGRDVSSLILYVAIVGRIAATDVPLAGKLGVLAVSIGIITAAFWVPIIAPITIPRRAHGWLRPAGRWIDHHARAITVSIAWAMAALLLYHGLVLGH